MTDRSEGWGNLDNARDAHYFRNDRSLCGRWMTFSTPRWEANQDIGPQPKPRSGTCTKCWRKRAAEEARSSGAVDRTTDQP